MLLFYKAKPTSLLGLSNLHFFSSNCVEEKKATALKVFFKANWNSLEKDKTLHAMKKKKNYKESEKTDSNCNTALQQHSHCKHGGITLKCLLVGISYNIEKPARFIFAIIFFAGQKWWTLREEKKKKPQKTKKKQKSQVLKNVTMEIPYKTKK